MDSSHSDMKRRDSIGSSSSRSSHESTSKCKECSCLTTVSNVIVRGLEKAFYSVGYGIATYPWVVLLAGVLLTIAFVPGLTPLFFYQEWAPDKLWVPLGSQSLEDKLFVDEHFPTSIRFQSFIVEADNVLTPGVIQGMLDIDMDIKAIVTDPSKMTWEDVCARLGPECWSNSLLELWSFDETTIRGLSQSDILTAVNTVTISPVFGSEYNVSQVLGEITRDPSSGDITGARATYMQWVISPNGTVEERYDDTLDDILDWEDEFLEIAETGNPSFSDWFYFAGKTFAEEGGGAIVDDVLYLAVGYILVIIFIAIVLGRFTRIRHRIYVSFAGVICIGLSIICSYGLCSYCGLFYGPVHSVLPFLLLGIGVDDMFVICQSLDQLGPEKDALPTRERIGYALQHAGVSITVTSLTDILAFAVGSSTIIPALRSFCAYAAVGVFFTFLFQATFLVACLTYDDKRIKGERNACCCCIVHKDDVPNSCSNTLLVQTAFDKFYAPLMVKLPTKIVVIIITLGLLGVNIYGVVNLEQDFDIAWFLPSDTYAGEYVEAYDTYFPSVGTSSAVFFGDIDYYTDYDTLESLYTEVRDDPYIASSTVDCWYYAFRVWMNTTTDPLAVPLLGPGNYPTSEDDFYTLLGLFLPSDGARFLPDLDLREAPPLRIDASRVGFLHINLVNAAIEIDAMDSVRAAVAGYGYPPDQLFVYSSSYLTFESNKVILRELFRNLGLAFLCVFVMTLILLANFVACIMVCLCVIMSLVNVGGCMMFWGLTIDTVTSINLIVAIGLTVDYSAHIAHTFLTMDGTRNDRTFKTLSSIGPPVLFGGFSTFLAFVTLAGSTSYVFITFFQVFLLVVLFGLYHGMVVLPVILSWVGPKPYGIVEREPAFGSNAVISAYDNSAYQNGNLHVKTPADDNKTPHIETTQENTLKDTWKNLDELRSEHTAAESNVSVKERAMNGDATQVLGGHSGTPYTYSIDPDRDSTMSGSTLDTTETETGQPRYITSVYL